MEPQLFYWNEENQAWQRDRIVRQSYDRETALATFAIYHLTEFALFAEPASPLAQSIFIPVVMGD